jgi:hypothetical protein
MMAGVMFVSCTHGFVESPDSMSGDVGDVGLGINRGLNARGNSYYRRRI